MEQNEETQLKVSNRKPGRTLLVSNEYNLILKKTYLYFNTQN